MLTYLFLWANTQALFVHMTQYLDTAEGCSYLYNGLQAIGKIKILNEY